MKKGDRVFVKFESPQGGVNLVPCFFQWFDDPKEGELFQRATVRLEKDGTFLDSLDPSSFTVPLTKSARKIVKAVYKELSEVREDAQTTAEYLHAIRNVNMVAIGYFQSFGKYVRQQIMNVHEYRNGLRFGFRDVTFDEHGWLDNATWVNRETVEFRVKVDNATCNCIELAQGMNGSWAWGYYSKHGSGSGGGYAPSVYDSCYPDRSTCLDAATRFLRDKLIDTVGHAEEYPSPVNYNIPYMKSVIACIEGFVEMATAPVQLTLFS
ncbi:MAG: hypothetical protein IM613_12975 [Cytophagales bacterium]|nr:hypothetical protein [Cytophagales bacterium]